jgi:hypothetical protein
MVRCEVCRAKVAATLLGVANRAIIFAAFRPCECAHNCGGPSFGRLASEGECPRCDALRDGEARREHPSPYRRG